jgi:hypothetical protein
MKVKERSSNTVISTGIIRPACCAVRSLNSLTKAMMFTPAWPSAGPTGGAGVALPAGTCNFTILTTFFGIYYTSLFSFFNLSKINFNRCFAPKHVHKNLQLAAFFINFGNAAKASGKRAAFKAYNLL